VAGDSGGEVICANQWRHRLKKEGNALVKVLRMGQAVVGGINLGASISHVLELRPKRKMSGRDWLTTQRAYADYGKLAGPLLPASVLTSVISAIGSRKDKKRAGLFALNAICSIAAANIWATMNEPVNREIVAWNPEKLPYDWEVKRDSWEYGHAMTAGVHLAGFIALMAALLPDSDDES
jgi:hypothetical protein